MLLRHEQNSQLAIHRGLRATNLLERLVTMLAPVAQEARNYLLAQPVTRAGLPSSNVASPIDLSPAFPPCHDAIRNGGHHADFSAKRCGSWNGDCTGRRRGPACP